MISVLQHVQGVEDELGAQVIGDGLAHDPAGIHVQDDGAIQPTPPRRRRTG